MENTFGNYKIVPEVQVEWLFSILFVQYAFYALCGILKMSIKIRLKG